MTTINHLSLLLFFTLTLPLHAKLNLTTADHRALLTTLQHLGVSPELRRPGNLCTSAGIFCQPRVSTNAHVLKVTGIVLKSHKLKGFLSPAIGELPEIKELSFPNNYIGDRIPPQIAGCRKLEVINFRNNTFLIFRRSAGGIIVSRPPSYPRSFFK
ncbi:hypothetical protein L6452_33691 [Arctium lappa]|uniref:Uncharacterized protein n=1 Tax=Arctium lappa TaxID=4217 RepID=A0ACB8YG31_ARCLA|nr:hypothetical protein L6452_33691 [Arctium lappa]